MAEIDERHCVHEELRQELEKLERFYLAEKELAFATCRKATADYMVTLLIAESVQKQIAGTFVRAPGAPTPFWEERPFPRDDVWLLPEEWNDLCLEDGEEEDKTDWYSKSGRDELEKTLQELERAEHETNPSGLMREVITKVIGSIDSAEKMRRMEKFDYYELRVNVVSDEMELEEEITRARALVEKSGQEYDQSRITMNKLNQKMAAATKLICDKLDQYEEANGAEGGALDK